MTQPPRDRAILENDLAFGFLDATHPSRRAFNPELIRNSSLGHTALRAIKHEMKRSERMRMSVAFVTTGGLALLKQDLIDSRAPLTLVTSTYLNFNEPSVFRELAGVDNLDVRIIDDPQRGFHAKGYLFDHGSTLTSIVGSSNLTRNALLSNEEWNVRVTSDIRGDFARQLHESIEEQVSRSVPLHLDWIEDYEQRWERLPRFRVIEPETAHDEVTTPIVPNAMQQEALTALRELRAAGKRRALVISATGTGKTILAALAAREMAPERMLVVAHQEQILSKSMRDYHRVLGGPASDFSLVAAGRGDLHARYVFGTVQSLSRENTLDRLHPEAFDLVIVDEVHRATAASYQRVLQRLQPDFLLGITATPERTDGACVYELFDHNVPYEIRLQQALEEGMLAPFNYYGIEDYTRDDGETVSEDSPINHLSSPERAGHIVAALERYGHASGVKGLIFCSRNDEAAALAEELNHRSVFGKQLRTRALSGANSAAERDTAIAELTAGKLDYLLSVDIFNEGIDIPEVNQVVMLRATQSSIVFTQQLGRGLRKTKAKDHLRVIDFIGNYANNFLIPIALFGDTSLNKDVVRQRVTKAIADGAIAGVSSINFTHVARERIFRSLAQARLDTRRALRTTFAEVRDRLGRLPMLIDFAKMQSVDPTVIASNDKNYWRFVIGTRTEIAQPSEQQHRFLNVFTYELLDGKRPHELLLMEHLLAHPEEILTTDEVAQLFAQHGCTNDQATIASVLAILRLSFATQAERDSRHGEVGLLDNEHIRLHPEFAREYRDCPELKGFVDDVVATGLYLSTHRYGGASELIVGERYSRRDVCRMLNWSGAQQGTMYGYKVDAATNTCPIFVTYHKAEDTSESTAYEDEFLSETEMRWYTRSRRTLQSDEVRAILREDNAPTLHLFVKKDDAEGTEFYYVGTATPTWAQDTTMPKSGESVVEMRLALTNPLSPTMLEYFTGTDAAGLAQHVRMPDVAFAPDVDATALEAHRQPARTPLEAGSLVRN